MTETHGYRATLGLVAASTLLSMVAFSGTLGNGITLAEALLASPAGLSWILASMSVGLAVTLLPVGVLADRLGRRAVFLLGALLFVGANAVCAAADDTAVFVFARILVGVGATGMIATGLGLVAAVPGAAARYATTAMWWSAAMGAGIAVGPVLSGVLDLVDGWRMFYLLLAAAGAMTAVAGWVLLPRTGTSTRADGAQPAGGSQLAEGTQPAGGAQRRRFDIVGFILLLALLTVLITAIVEVRTGAPRTVAVLFGGAAVLALGLVISQTTGTRRLIPPQVLAHRPFQISTFAGFGAGAGIIAIMAYSATYFAAELGMSTLQAGALTTLWSGTSAVAAFVLSRLSARMSGPAQLATGLFGAGAGILLMAGAAAGAGLLTVCAGLVLAGAASGLLNGGLAREAVGTVPPEHAATGTAANNTARYFGAAIGVSVAGMLVSGQVPAAGWNQLVLITAGISVLTGFIVLAGRLRRGSRAG